MLDYDRAPSALVEFFADDGQPNEAGGRARVWIDTANDTLARVDATLGAQEISQAFTSYGAPIEIEAPDVLAEVAE